MNGQLLIGSITIVIIVIIHIISLVLLSRYLGEKITHTFYKSNVIGQTIIISTALFASIAIHVIEAWIWAVLYYLLGEFENLQNALYFSVVTLTTLGYGDITLSNKWQLLSAFEAMGGLLLFGFTTAFLISFIQSLLFTKKV